METKKRSIAKTASWRILATLTTFVISYVITGSFAAAGGIASIEVISKIVLYYYHERAWNKMEWGKNEAS